MGNIAKKHHNKFDPDTKRNDEALGFFQRASPPNNNNNNNNNNNKISSVWGPVPGQKIATFKNCKTSLSNGKRISSVDQILSALEEVKVRLPFFLYTLYKTNFSLVI